MIKIDLMVTVIIVGRTDPGIMVSGRTDSGTVEAFSLKLMEMSTREDGRETIRMALERRNSPMILVVSMRFLCQGMLKIGSRAYQRSMVFLSMRKYRFIEVELVLGMIRLNKRVACVSNYLMIKTIEII